MEVTDQLRVAAARQMREPVYACSISFVVLRWSFSTKTSEYGNDEGVEREEGY